MRYSTTTRNGVSFFTTMRGGRVAWEGGSDAACDDCGCEIHTGRRNGETDSELKKRLRGKRARLVGSTVACANCGHEYTARGDDVIDLRALVAERRKAFGLTRAALAALLAPRWGGVSLDSAESALYRFEKGRGELAAERLADVLTELGLEVRLASDGASG